MRKENKVLLKVLVEKSQKRWVEKCAKEMGISEAEFIRLLIKAKKGK